MALFSTRLMLKFDFLLCKYGSCVFIGKEIVKTKVCVSNTTQKNRYNTSHIHAGLGEKLVMASVCRASCVSTAFVLRYLFAIVVVFSLFRVYECVRIAIETSIISLRRER